ncbi:hypothetical protein BC834DRAFT_890947 [Gloeopeniophorella convolvens]|nr:hypothetical protein BC834DRAFT_890947 [Gloeopeniophorella convolvens]
MVASKVWLVTGASTGLGLALVHRALLRGERVIATARSLDGRSEFDALRTDPTIDQARLRLLKLDVTAPFEEIQIQASEAFAFWQRIDVIVNNASGWEDPSFGPIEELGAKGMMACFNTHFIGTINVTNAFLPYMRAQKEGTIVIVGSRSAYRNEIAGLAPYAASKAAVHSYGETLSVELLPFGIRVLIVAPGTFNAGPQPVFTNPTPPYLEAHKLMRERLEKIAGKKGKGDPKRGMDVVVDVVRGEGRAASRVKEGKWPLWLVLGEDALQDVRARADKLRDTLTEWAGVGSDLGYENEEDE